MTEPVLMPFQNLPFNGDIFICDEFLKLKEEFNITTAVETGSCLYSTTKWLGENFDKVYTVEINEEYAKHGRHKVAYMQNVVAEIGVSDLWIATLANHLTKDDSCIFFLDAHWGKDCPLLKELEAISKLEYDIPPVITIHDFKTPNEEFGFDTYDDKPFTFELIKNEVEKIYAKTKYYYDCYYNTEAVGAKRGIIYIKPDLKWTEGK
jgi:hypothetical protein